MVAALPNARYSVRLQSGAEVLARPTAKLRLVLPRLTVGDQVMYVPPLTELGLGQIVGPTRRRRP